LDPAEIRAAASDPGGSSAAAGGPSVLLAEHEPAVAAMLARYLSREGLRVRPAASPELALAGLADGADAVAVLDLTMPGLDPRRVRQALASPMARPVVLLAAPGPRPRGLNTQRGVTRRWLTRPFAPRQLVATLRELLDAARPPAAVSPQASSITGLLLDNDRRVAVVAGREVPLTGKEFAILTALLGVHGRPCTRRQLLAAAASGAGERSVDVHIAGLRAKLGIPGLIRTVRGAGFAIGTPDYTGFLSWPGTGHEGGSRSGIELAGLPSGSASLPI
jgi:DNA-binding response OmpR family regulator